MNHLPKGWASTTVSSMIELNPKTDAPDEALAGFSPMPLLGTRYRDPVGFAPRRWGDIRKSYVHFQDGDVLLAKITPCFENGKAGLVRGMPSAIGAGSSEYLVCRPYPEALDPRYLLALFKTDEFLKAGETRMTGSVGHKRVPKDYLLETELALAPRAEQFRIADKLDALLARVDECSERLDRLPILAMRFRQSVLAAAMNGELSADWREAAVRAMDWEESTIGSVATDLRYGTSKKCDYREVGTPVLRIPNIGEHGRLELADMKRCDFEDVEVERLSLRPGDLLVIRSNGSVELVGKTGVVDNDAAGMLFAGYLMRLRVDPKLAIAKFVQLSLASPEVRRQIELTSKSTSGVNNLNADELRGMPLPLPQLDEQAEIVRRVESLFALANAIEAKCKTARAQVERLTPAILAKAFRGELVPQDPNDEPASELLARLQAERGAAPARKTRARKAAGDAA